MSTATKASRKSVGSEAIAANTSLVSAACSGWCSARGSAARDKLGVDVGPGPP
jgi:hypothetical protein